MILSQFNFMAIALASLGNMIIGMLWYSPLLFGPTWMKAMGFTEKDLNAGPAHFAGGFLTGATIALGLSYVFKAFAVTSVNSAIEVAATLCLTFIATSNFSGVIWEQRRLDWFFISVGYWMTTFVSMAVILVKFN